MALGFGSLFTGSNKYLDQSIANSGNLMNFGTNLGERDLTAGSDFYNTILKGDPAAIGKLLGPQFSDIQKQGQQQIQTQGEFGNRSGGTNAGNQQNIDSQRAEVERMIAQLTGGAAGAVTGIGENALGTALSAGTAHAQEAQDELNNIMNSLNAQITGSAIGSAESAALGHIPGF